MSTKPNFPLSPSFSTPYRTPVPNYTQERENQEILDINNIGGSDVDSQALEYFEKLGGQLTCQTCEDRGFEPGAGTLRKAGTAGPNKQRRFRCSQCGATMGPSAMLKLVEAHLADNALMFMAKRGLSPMTTPASLIRHHKLPKNAPQSPLSLIPDGNQTPEGLNVGGRKDFLVLDGSPAQPNQPITSQPDLYGKILALENRIRSLEKENEELRNLQKTSVARSEAIPDDFYDGAQHVGGSMQITPNMVNSGIYGKKARVNAKVDSKSSPKRKAGPKDKKAKPKPKRELPKLDSGAKLVSVDALLPRPTRYQEIRKDLRLAGVQSSKVLDISRCGRTRVYTLTMAAEDQIEVEKALGRLHWSQVKFNLANSSMVNPEEMVEGNNGPSKSLEQTTAIVKAHVRSKAASIRARPDSTFEAFLLGQTWGDILACFPDFPHKSFGSIWSAEMEAAHKGATGKLVGGSQPAAAVEQSQ